MTDTGPYVDQQHPWDDDRWHLDWHRPQVYRYEVASCVRRRFPRAILNRYPGCIIGAAVVVGRFAYCVKWGNPGALRHGGRRWQR